MNSDDCRPERMPPDLTLTNDQYERIRLLAPAELARIDNGLLSYAIHKWRKVSFLVGSALLQLQSDIPNVPDTLYILRVQRLIDEGRLELNGDMDHWRHSEVRLPVRAIE